MALFRRTPADPQPSPEPAGQPVSGAKKDRPTPTRRQAEAARRQRVTKTYSKREARAYASREARERRLNAVRDRESQPEKILMRDYVDSRFNLGEYLLPSVVVILAVTVLGSYYPTLGLLTTLVMYTFLFAVIVDSFLMWRGFKKVLAQRMPRAQTRGLMMYGITRGTQLRRFRMPPARLKRGDSY